MIFVFNKYKISWQPNDVFLECRDGFAFSLKRAGPSKCAAEVL